MRRGRAPDGFSQVELLLAGTMSVLVLSLAAVAMSSHIRTSGRLEVYERQRSDWSRTNHFIEAEVALSEAVLTDPALVEVPAACGPVAAGQFRFALRIRPDLPLAIYLLRPSLPPWMPDNSLFRCGPEIDADGGYVDGAEPAMALLMDGLEGRAAGGGLLAQANPADPRSLELQLSIQGLGTQAFRQAASGQGRVSPVYVQPDSRAACGSSATPPPGVICDGRAGSTADEILEKAGAHGAQLIGGGGNDRLLGTAGHDSLVGGSGNDVLIGNAGNDVLEGGSAGTNLYLPGPGNDTILGGRGLDVLFLPRPRSAVSVGSCNRSSCSLTFADGSVQARGLELLIFSDRTEPLP